MDKLIMIWKSLNPMGRFLLLMIALMLLIGAVKGIIGEILLFLFFMIFAMIFGGTTFLMDILKGKKETDAPETLEE